MLDERTSTRSWASMLRISKSQIQTYLICPRKLLSQLWLGLPHLPLSFSLLGHVIEHIPPVLSIPPIPPFFRLARGSASPFFCGK